MFIMPIKRRKLDHHSEHKILLFATGLAFGVSMSISALMLGSVAAFNMPVFGVTFSTTFFQLWYSILTPLAVFMVLWIIEHRERFVEKR